MRLLTAVARWRNIPLISLMVLLGACSSGQGGSSSPSSVTPSPSAAQAATGTSEAPTHTAASADATQPISADGTWRGTISDGFSFTFDRRGDAVVAVGFNLDIEGCVHPVVLLDWQGAGVAISDDSFASDERRDQLDAANVAVEGSFDPTSRVWSGSATVTCGEGAPVSLPWRADTFEPMAADAGAANRSPVDVDVLLGRIPDMAIPDDLFIRDADDQNFDEWTRVVGAAGDWLLATYAYSVYPIPRGWTTVNTHNEENRLLFRRGGLVMTGDSSGGFEFDPPAEITILIGSGWETSFDTSAEIVEETKQLDGTSGLTLRVAQVLDSEKAYLLFDQITVDGDSNYLLIFWAKQSNAEGSRGFSSITAVWDAEDPEAYYSIVRAIIGGWADLENNLLGAELPATLP